MTRDWSPVPADEVEDGLILFDGQPVVAVPEDRPLAARLIDDDEGGLRFRLGNHPHAARCDSIGLERFHLKPSHLVAADLAYVTRSETQPRERDHSGSSLPARCTHVR